jgi:hypothetical protein
MSCRQVATHSLLALVVVISFLTAPDRTLAAMWAVLTLSPERPAAGERAEVLIRTFATYGPDAVGSLGHDGPIPAPSDSVLVMWGVDYPFQVVAFGPDGQRIDIEVHQDPSDASLHRGTVAFPSPGDWTLRLPQFPGPEDAPGIRLAVTVTERTPLREGAPPIGDLAPLVVAAGLGVIAGLGVALALRRRASSRDTGAR